MASAKTLSDGSGVSLRGRTITLRIADPYNARLQIDLPVSNEHAAHLFSELRLAIQRDGGARYNAILAAWYSLVKRALGL